MLCQVPKKNNYLIFLYSFGVNYCKPEEYQMLVALLTTHFAKKLGTKLSNMAPHRPFVFCYDAATGQAYLSVGEESAKVELTLDEPVMSVQSVKISSAKSNAEVSNVEQNSIVQQSSKQ